MDSLKGVSQIATRRHGTEVYPTGGTDAKNVIREDGRLLKN